MSNNLIIGLGGTGGKIIRSLRKTFYQEFKDNRPEDVFVRYLYVDTSNEMMELDDPSWKVMGNSVQLGVDSTLHIKAENLSHTLEEIDRFPGIKPWIGSRSDWMDLINDAKGQKTAGGQRRRLGRFIFASNVSGFNNAVSSLVGKLHADSNQNSVTFHICAGLAGGTGSGILIDVIAQIRKKFTDINSYNIMLYLYLPEENPKPNRDMGSYHANGYAALMELNAFAIGRLLPNDITGDNLGQRLKVESPFTGCYVFTNKNENGIIINDIDNDVPEVLADFLFFKLIAARRLSWERLIKAESSENGDPSPEMDGGNKLPERSKRFLTFGIKRLTVPEEEIREYITYNYARQAALQLRYNNWTDEEGYINQLKPQNYNEYVRQIDTWQKWMITDEHLCLSVPIIKDTASKNWVPFNKHWENLVPEYKVIARGKDKKQWFDELAILCSRQFDEQFRNTGGVVRFFESKWRDKKDLAKAIRNNVENELFDNWKNGVQSLFDLSRLLAALLESLQQRLTAVDDRIGKLHDSEVRAAAAVKENNLSWAKVGYFSEVFGSRDRLLDAQGNALQDLYIIRTRLEAWKFAKPFIAEIIAEIEDLKANVDRANVTISDGLDEFEKNIAERCKDTNGKAEDTAVLQKQVVRFYEPETVRTVVKKFIKNEQEQRSQTAKVRQAITIKLGEHPTFSLFNDRIGKTSFVSLMEDVCEANSRQAEANLIENPREKLTGVSIIGKLKDRFDGNDEGLRKYIKKLVEFAGNYANFSNNEITKQGSGTQGGVTKVTDITVFMPKSEEYAAFVARMRDAFEFSKPAHVGAIDFIEITGRPHEITIITITNLFPLRFLQPTDMLREKYLLRLTRDDAKKAKMFLHIEGDGSELPRLFVPTEAELLAELAEARQRARPKVLWAYAMNLLHEKTDENGYKKLALVQKDDFGDEEAVFYMELPIEQASDSLTRENADTLVIKTDGELKKITHADQKRQLKEKAIGIVNEMKTRIGEGTLYLEYKKYAQQLLDLLN